MSRLRRTILPLLLVTAAALGSGSAADAATRTSTFVHSDPGVRAAAMGGAFTAQGGQPIAMYWNPATLYYQERRSMEASYSSLYGLGLARRTFLTLGFKSTIELPRFEGRRVVVDRDSRTGSAYALGIQSLSLDVGDDGYSEVSLGGAAAWGYGDRLAVGVSLRGLFIGSDLDQVSANGYDLGMGIAWQLSAHERVGVSVPHLVSRLFWDFDTTERLPLSLQVGWMRAWSRSLLTSADVELREGENEPYRIAAGVEWWAVAERVALRGGFRRLDGGLERVSEPTFGAGLVFGRLQVDYAFRLEPESLGDTHRIGLRADF